MSNWETRDARTGRTSRMVIEAAKLCREGKRVYIVVSHDSMIPIVSDMLMRAGMVPTKPENKRSRVDKRDYFIGFNDGTICVTSNQTGHEGSLISRALNGDCGSMKLGDVNYHDAEILVDHYAMQCIYKRELELLHKWDLPQD